MHSCARLERGQNQFRRGREIVTGVPASIFRPDFRARGGVDRAYASKGGFWIVVLAIAVAGTLLLVAAAAWLSGVPGELAGGFGTALVVAALLAATWTATSSVRCCRMLGSSCSFTCCPIRYERSWTGFQAGTGLRLLRAATYFGGQPTCQTCCEARLRVADERGFRGSPAAWRVDPEVMPPLRLPLRHFPIGGPLAAAIGGVEDRYGALLLDHRQKRIAVNRRWRALDRGSG
jgi:hypothetical protein